MELFDPNSNDNLLPADGEVYYYGQIISGAEASDIFHVLMTDIDWQPDEAIIFGKRVITKRKVAWYGDKEFNYTYSKITKLALPWTKALLHLKQLAEKHSGHTYNSCLLNLYHNGSEGMAWHSDGEKDLEPNGAIASMSFGAERKFAFKHKQTKELININLAPGSLLVMKGSTQSHWLHRLPPTKKVNTPRVNLTFRTIVGQ
jgi:alkylated DNA repair dioxygenase AlkB